MASTHLPPPLSHLQDYWESRLLLLLLVPKNNQNCIKYWVLLKKNKKQKKPSHFAQVPTYKFNFWHLFMKTVPKSYISYMPQIQLWSIMATNLFEWK